MSFNADPDEIQHFEAFLIARSALCVMRSKK